MSEQKIPERYRLDSYNEQHSVFEKEQRASGKLWKEIPGLTDWVLNRLEGSEAQCAELTRQLEAMTKDRDLWAADHGDDCPYKARVEELERELSGFKPADDLFMEQAAQIALLTQERNASAIMRRDLVGKVEELQAALDERNNRGTGFLYIPKAWHEAKVAEQATLIRELRTFATHLANCTCFSTARASHPFHFTGQCSCGLNALIAKLPKECQ